MRRLFTLVSLATLTVALTACGSSSSDGAAVSGWTNSDEPAAGPGDEGAYADTSSAGGQDAGSVPAPELEEEFAPPSAGDRYVFVLNEAREQVVVLDAESLDIELVEVGLRPTVLATAPGHDVAVVVNAGGSDISVLHAAPAGTEIATVSAVAGLNRVVVAPDGRHAVAYFDYDAIEDGEPVGSLQSVVLVRAIEGEVESVEVGTGFNPRAVHYTEDSEGDIDAAYVVTEEGLTRIPLDGELPDIGVLPSIAVSDDPLAAVLEREVLVTPDGGFAVARTLGQAQLTVVDLDSADITSIALSGEPTDVDLTPSGEAVLVMFPTESRAALANIEALVEDGADALSYSDLGGLAMGAATVSPDGEAALLYTTVAAIESLIHLDLASGEATPILLQKTVRAVTFGPSSRRALVLHRTSGVTLHDGLPLDQFVDASEAYSVVDADAAVARLELTDVRPGQFSFTPGGERLYILLPDLNGDAHAVDDIELSTLMSVNRPLPSPPESVQPVPAAGKVAVSQEHPTGRITFFDIASGESDTLTGFQLGGLID